MQIKVNVTVETAGADRLIAGLAAMQSGNAPQPVVDMFNQWGKRVEAFTRKRFEVFSRGGGDWPPLALSTIQQRRGGKTKKGEFKVTTTGEVMKVRRKVKRGKFGEKIVTKELVKAGKNDLFSSVARDTKRGGMLVAAGKNVNILRDTGILFKALTIGAPGSTFEVIPGGIRYGVAGQQRHAGLVATIAGKAASTKNVTIGDIAAFHQFGAGRLPKREIIVVPDQRVLDNMAGDAARAAARLMEGN